MLNSVGKLRKDEEVKDNPAQHIYAKPPTSLAKHPLFSGATSVGMITADNPRFPTAFPAANQEALKNHFRQQGLKFEETHGSYGAPENTLLVYGPTREQMYNAGKQFGQEAVVYSERGQPHEMLYTNGEHDAKINPGLSHVRFHPTEPFSDFYTYLPGHGYVTLHFGDQFLDSPAIKRPEQTPTKNDLRMGLLTALKRSMVAESIRDRHSPAQGVIVSSDALQKHFVSDSDTNLNKVKHMSKDVFVTPEDIRVGLAKVLKDKLAEFAKSMKDLREKELKKKSPPGKSKEVEELKAKGLPPSEAFGIAWDQYNASHKGKLKKEIMGDNPTLGGEGPMQMAEKKPLMKVSPPGKWHDVPEKIVEKQGISKERAEKIAWAAKNKEDAKKAKKSEKEPIQKNAIMGYGYGSHPEQQIPGGGNALVQKMEPLCKECGKMHKSGEDCMGKSEAIKVKVKVKVPGKTEEKELEKGGDYDMAMGPDGSLAGNPPIEDLKYVKEWLKGAPNDEKAKRIVHELIADHLSNTKAKMEKADKPTFKRPAIPGRANLPGMTAPPSTHTGARGIEESIAGAIKDYGLEGKRPGAQPLPHQNFGKAEFKGVGPNADLKSGKPPYEIVANGKSCGHGHDSVASAMDCLRAMQGKGHRADLKSKEVKKAEKVADKAEGAVLPGDKMPKEVKAPGSGGEINKLKKGVLGMGSKVPVVKPMPTKTPGPTSAYQADKEISGKSSKGPFRSLVPGKKMGLEPLNNSKPPQDPSIEKLNEKLKGFKSLANPTSTQSQLPFTKPGK